MNKRNLPILVAVLIVVVLLVVGAYFKNSQQFVIKADAPQVVAQTGFKKWFGIVSSFFGTPLYAYDVFHSAIAILEGGLEPVRFGHVLLRLAEAECKQNPDLVRVNGSPLFTLLVALNNFQPSYHGILKDYLNDIPVIGHILRFFGKEFPTEKEVTDTVEFLRNNIKQEQGVACVVMLQIILDYEDFWRRNGNYSEQFFTNLDVYRQEIENIFGNVKIAKREELKLFAIEIDKYTNGKLKDLFDSFINQSYPCDCNKENPWSSSVIGYFESYLNYLKDQIIQVEIKKNFYEGILNLPNETLEKVRENIEKSIQESPDGFYLYVTYRDFYRKKDFSTEPIVNSLDNYKLVVDFLDFHIGGLEERIKLVEDFIKKVKLLTPAGLIEEIKDVEQSIDFLKGARDHFSSFPVTKENEKEILGRINRIIDQIDALGAKLARLKEELRCRQQQQKAWRLSS